MKKLIFPTSFLLLTLASAFTFLNTVDWKVQKENYSVKFTSKKFDGMFKGLEASILFDEADLANSKISASIDAGSVNTGNGMRNKHAAKALGVKDFPKIKFESTSITKKGDGYEAAGKLTINDVTKEMALPFTFEKNDNGGVFAGKFPVVLEEYHVDKKGAPETVEVILNVPVTK